MKSKPCLAPECNNPRFGGGYCIRHQMLREDKRVTSLKRAGLKRTTQPRPISSKMIHEIARYRTLRKKFLELNPRCAVYPHLPATEIHHKKGRGIYLNDVSTWLAVSRQGHRKIEENPEWAKEMGFSLPRNSK